MWVLNANLLLIFYAGLYMLSYCALFNKLIPQYMRKFSLWILFSSEKCTVKKMFFLKIDFRSQISIISWRAWSVAKNLSLCLSFKSNYRIRSPENNSSENCSRKLVPKMFAKTVLPCNQMELLSLLLDLNSKIRTWF